MKEYDEFEPKYREMDPVTEKLLFDGSRLRNGMIVLPGSPELRVDIRENMPDAELDRAREHNRWVLVTELVISDATRGGISFIAVYPDHTERKISAPMFWPWLVKRDSLPADYDPSALAKAPAKEHDEIFNESTRELVLEGSREECLEWMRKNRDLSEDVRVSLYDRDDLDLISGTQYLVIYG